MSEHRATVEWQRSGEFRYESYSRSHVVKFEGNIEIPGSAAPGNIPPTAAGAPGVDPEQAFVNLYGDHQYAFWLDSTASARRASQCSVAFSVRHVVTQSASLEPWHSFWHSSPAVSPS